MLGLARRERAFGFRNLVDELELRLERAGFEIHKPAV
jgi:hypothetical protein